MTKRIKSALTIVLSVLLCLALGVGIYFALMQTEKETLPLRMADADVATAGTYNVEALTAEEYTAFAPKCVLSIDKAYMLVIVGIDDVNDYDALDMDITEHTTALEVDLENTYYTGIIVKTNPDNPTETAKWTIESIFATEATKPNGMMVYEVEYTADVAYEITPYLTQTAAEGGATLTGATKSVAATKLYTLTLTGATLEGVEGETVGDTTTYQVAYGSQVNVVPTTTSDKTNLGWKDKTGNRVDSLSADGFAVTMPREDTAYTAMLTYYKVETFATAPTTNKSSAVATNSMTVNVAESGMYAVYLDYDYVKQTDESKQDVGALVNKTLYPSYDVRSGHLNETMVGFIYSINYLNNEQGYNANYFNVYMQSGSNELVLHSCYATNASYSVTIRGAKLILVEQTEGYVVTNHIGKLHSGADFGSNVGFNLNYISNSNAGVRKEDSATITLTGGTYDLTYLAAGHTSHTDNELKITLTKGDTEIVMTSNKIYGNANTAFNNAAGKMLLSDNLYVYENGALTNTHLVDLEAGEWTVKVYCTNTTKSVGLTFGGLFFTNVSAN